MWVVEFTDQFEELWDGLTALEQDRVGVRVVLLERRGPALGRPTVDRIRGSRHQHMKELRVESAEANIRVLFAFDPRRAAILLLGGNKAGRWRQWYEEAIPMADRLYDEHLKEIENGDEN